MALTIGLVYSCPASERRGSPPSASQVSKATRAGADYLIRHCHAKGRFAYRLSRHPRVTYPARYNILRHAGTVHVLALYLASNPDDTNLRNCLKKSSEFLIDETIRPLPNRNDLLAVWSAPAIDNTQLPFQAKLGGSGLGLAALAQLYHCDPNLVEIDFSILRKLAEFICYMQKKDGSFYSKYVISAGGRTDAWVSQYYPGEAAVGLLTLYRIDPNEKWLRAAVSALAYLARMRSEKLEVPPDHWALIASAMLLDMKLPDRIFMPRALLLEHMRKIVGATLAARPFHLSNSPALGALTPNGCTTPTACRLEGLLYAIPFMADKSVLRSQARLAVNSGIDFLLRSQIKSGPHAGGIPRAIRPLHPSHPEFSQRFNLRAGEVRIDYVQHAMSAFMQYERLITNSGER